MATETVGRQEILKWLENYILDHSTSLADGEFHEQASLESLNISTKGDFTDLGNSFNIRYDSIILDGEDLMECKTVGQLVDKLLDEVNWEDEEDNIDSALGDRSL